MQRTLPRLPFVMPGEEPPPSAPSVPAVRWNPSVPPGLPHNKQRQRVDDRSGSGAVAAAARTTSASIWVRLRAVTTPPTVAAEATVGERSTCTPPSLCERTPGRCLGSLTPSNVACSSRCKRSVESTADRSGLGERPRCRRSSASDRRRRPRRFDAGPRHREKVERSASFLSSKTKSIHPASLARQCAVR